MPEVLTLFVLNFFFFIFATLAFILAFRISLFYKKDETTAKQYLLEKQSYLAATIIRYIFIIKIPLFIFFIFTLEKIALILPGAMCSAGVVNATDYGVYLLMFKLLNLYLFAFWILLNAQDMKSQTQMYVKIKFQVFILFYLFFLLEIGLETLMFLSIDIKNVVDCCGVVFSINDGTYMAKVIGLPSLIQVALFYGVFLLMIFAFIKKYKKLYSVINVLFLFVSLATLIGFFGTYIYEMPTHHCPFCMLAFEYNYIGYFLYLFLFLGTFYGGVLALLSLKNKETSSYFKRSMLFNTAYVIVVSAYVLIYYIKNSLWL